jgi:hypothetical protein
MELFVCCSKEIDFILVLLMYLTDMFQEMALLFYVLCVEGLNYAADLLVLTIPEHLQYFGPVLRGLSDLSDHLVEARSNQSLLILELLRVCLTTFLDGAHLVLKPHNKILDLLLLREHLLVPRLRLLQKVGVELVVSLVYLLFLIALSQVPDDGIDGRQLHHTYIILDVFGLEGIEVLRVCVGSAALVEFIFAV